MVTRITLISLGGVLLMLIAMIIIGYEAGHYDGMRCNCAPDQPFWRKWLHVHRAKS